jgi:DNA (cytosine-5)-methyltransferase 1
MADGHSESLARARTFPLAPRQPGDVGKLRAIGNAINPVVAAQFIAAWMECAP